MTGVATVLVAALPLSARAAQLRAALGAVLGGGPAGDGGVTIWAQPWTRGAPLPVAGSGVQVMDLHDAVAACPAPASQQAWCARVAAACRGASLVLVGSAAAHGFWSALLAQAGVTCPLAVVPYAPAAVPARGDALVVAGPWVADPALRPMLEAALAWAARTGISVSGGAAADAGGALAMAALVPATGVAPGVLLDLRQDTPAERVATPCWVVDALAAGAAVLTTVDGPLGHDIASAGAGRVLAGGFMPPPEGAGGAGQGLVPSVEGAADSLREAIARAGARAAAARAAWREGPAPQPLGANGRVLVISDEAQTLAAVRIHLPLDALRQRGAIGGYAVLQRGEVTADTHPGAAGGFDAIWVHRSADPEVGLLLTLLGRPFAYDIDDNLLAAPRYRTAFHPVAVQTTRDLLRRAAVVSCATERLGGLLSRRLGESLAARLVVTPNLARGMPMAREAGPPRAVIWASSDRPALADSMGAIVRAVRDHCLAHETRVVCIGAAAPEGLDAPGLTLEQTGLLPHAAYRAMLRELSPSVLVCPLETGADPDTQDFIDGKSDIKLIEALSEGLVGVFSRAAPFLDSALPGAILVENTYDAWVAGLHAAREACLSAPAKPMRGWPEGRDADGFGLAPWAAALGQVRLDAPVTLEELRRALDWVSLQRGALMAPQEFDEEDYLGNYADVREAVAAGLLPSGYAHYAGPGITERRFARKRATPEALGEPVWATLMHEIGRLEAGAGTRERALAGFERRLSLRRALAARAAAR